MGWSPLALGAAIAGLAWPGALQAQPAPLPPLVLKGLPDPDKLAEPEPEEAVDSAIRPTPPAAGCVSLAPEVPVGSNGVFRNGCDEAVTIAYCSFRPARAKDDVYDCEKGVGAIDAIRPRGRLVARSEGRRLYWIACRPPAWPERVGFMESVGISAVCLIRSADRTAAP